MGTDRATAEARLNQALRQSGEWDPRETYRQWIVRLRERDPSAYREALDYFDGVLVPSVARDGSDALAHWLEYGCRLAHWLAPGTAVHLDRSGKRHDLKGLPTPREHLILHFPNSTREPVLAVWRPSSLSPAQKAAYDLLVRGKLAVEEAAGQVL